jgi:hypothetical protein
MTQPQDQPRPVASADRARRRFCYRSSDLGCACVRPLDRASYEPPLGFATYHSRRCLFAISRAVATAQNALLEEGPLSTPMPWASCQPPTRDDAPRRRRERLSPLCVQEKSCATLCCTAETVAGEVFALVRPSEMPRTISCYCHREVRGVHLTERSASGAA